MWFAAQLTNLSIIVYFLWIAAYLLDYPGPARIFVAMFCGALVYVLSQTVFRESIEASENDAYRRVAKGLRNPRRIRDAQLRISFLTLSVLLPFVYWPFLHLNLRVPVIFMGYPLVVLTTAVLYVLACDPLPPCPGRLRLPAWVLGNPRPRLEKIEGL